MGKPNQRITRQFGENFKLVSSHRSNDYVFHRSVPLGLVTASVDGQSMVDNTALLETREAEFKLDTTKPYKINADTNGVCRLFHFPCHNAMLILPQTEYYTLLLASQP